MKDAHPVLQNDKREVMTYLSDYSERIGRINSKIPFSRNELADFLSVNRSAMSRELSRLKEEAI
jgi:CRP-like cAMP-binding protein